MKEIIVYEMVLKGDLPNSDINCTPFQKRYWNEYMQIYNECFYDMRKDLEIEPLNFYSDYSQMENKINDTFLYFQYGVIIGAVSCFGNELDDLIVNKPFQKRGYGQQLLIWGINHIFKQGYSEVVLHAAEWNDGAIKLYLKTGFTLNKKEKIR